MSLALKWKDMPYFPRMEHKGSMYTEKRIGPSMEPWGTPHGREAEEELTSLRQTEKLLSAR